MTNFAEKFRRQEDLSAWSTLKNQGMSLGSVVEEMANNGDFTSKPTLSRCLKEGTPHFVPGLKKVHIKQYYLSASGIAARLLIAEYNLRVVDSADLDALKQQLIAADATWSEEFDLFKLLKGTSYEGAVVDEAVLEAFDGQRNTYHGLLALPEDPARAAMFFMKAMERTEASNKLLENALQGQDLGLMLLLVRNVLNTFFHAYQLDQINGDKQHSRTYAVAVSRGNRFYKAVKMVAQWSTDPRLPYWTAEMAVMANKLADARELLQLSAYLADYKEPIEEWQPFWEKAPVRSNPWLSTIISN